jgi:hypothetical protein
MAAITVTNRSVGNHGMLKTDSGYFTAATSDIQIETKLGKVRYVSLRGQDTSNVNAPVYINSKTASAVEDDPGWIFITNDGGELANAKVYQFLAYGEG